MANRLRNLQRHRRNPRRRVASGYRNNDRQIAITLQEEENRLAAGSGQDDNDDNNNNENENG